MTTYDGVIGAAVLLPDGRRGQVWALAPREGHVHVVVPGPDGVNVIVPNVYVTLGMTAVLSDVAEERRSQIATYGHNADLLDGTGPDVGWLPGPNCAERWMDNGEPVCGVHGFQWPDGQTVCNAALGEQEEFGFTAGTATEVEALLRKDYDAQDKITWMHLVREEVAEAFKESDPSRLRAELIQVAALCVSWVEKLDER